MIEGWLLDVHENATHTGMIAWLVNTAGQATSCEVPWCPVLHVHASSSSLDQLEHWLEQPEIKAKFFIHALQRIRCRLDLNNEDAADVLEVEFRRYHRLRALAEHIESRGDFHRFTLYSVDAHLAQRFLNEHQCEPFQQVRWNPSEPSELDVRHTEEGITKFPAFHVLKVTAAFEPTNGPPSTHDGLRTMRFETVLEPGLERPHVFREPVVLERRSYADMQTMLRHVQQVLLDLDPDVILTAGGDQRLFPWLLEQGRVHGVELCFGRSDTPLAQSTNQRTIHSYGQTHHRHGAFFLEGRLHLDLKNSFIVNEGGVAGLFELAQQSCQSAQIISRLSPGSVISAIQMRVAMADGVLVPWKKNRPEDTKSALELLHADRGGLYLDSQPGVYSSVIELDFASLFPSIIATRNISPETLNCSCCQPSPSNTNGVVPLHPDEASNEFRQRRLRSQFGHGLFPLAHEKALRVPGLSTYTCGRTHGFLGRVVAPLIERRQQLKRQRQTKGDAYDLRQNALKWLLVTCFGYTGYRNARFGRIEAHEAICAWSRELLLQTIEEAHADGWDVLHAIVDCVWLADSKGRTHKQQRIDANAFARRISAQVGIPLEFEQHYDVIGFLPSRVHGSGSLTKYWAYGGGEFKVRGIEMRQHSTPPWVRELQRASLQILADGSASEGIPDRSTQKAVLTSYRSELQKLKRGEVPLSELVVARRVSKTLEQYRVKNLTYAALLRAHQHGHEVPPGGKIRYVVLDQEAHNLTERVLLMDELPQAKSSHAGCVAHYSALAERAVWAILAHFGWTHHDLKNSGLQPTLRDYGSR